MEIIWSADNRIIGNFDARKIDLSRRGGAHSMRAPLRKVAGGQLSVRDQHQKVA